MTKKITVIALLFILSVSSYAQENTKKFWLSGLSRGVYSLDELKGEETDTTSASKAEYGHTLVDLSANIRPNEHTYIRTTIRVRNDYGGFWGSGTTFGLRELYLRGLIANSVRYQVGDMDYKLSPFTFYNNNEDLYENTLDIFNMYSEMMHYDYFFKGNNTWRQQGLATDFSLSFKKGIEELQFNLFTSRINPSNFSTISDRVFFGGNLTMVQSDQFSAGLNYINLTDVAGTSNNLNYFKNPVLTGTYKVNAIQGDFKFQLDGESGFSKSFTENNEDPDNVVKENLVEDYFNYSTFTTDYAPLNLKFTIAYRNVGQGFRSAGAQMRRLKFATQAFMFNRYTNEQIVRPIGMWDIHNDPTLYNSQIQVGLAEFYPQYNNIDPYGLATPNRKGLDFDLIHIDEQNRYSFSLQYGMLSEIVGLGVDDLKKFNTLSANLDLNIENMLPIYDKQILIQLGYTNDQTKRTGDQDFIQTELNTQRIYAGITLELTDKLYYLAGYESIKASGDDYLANRDRNDVIDDFTLFETELSEKIIGMGLRYEFDDKNNLQILWQDYNWSNSVLGTEDYGFDRLSVIYIMKF
tara:strand:- start:2576 stop:4309 length:1734 start_codon:yes stop_codon:yes gene_type:complete